MKVKAILYITATVWIATLVLALNTTMSASLWLALWFAWILIGSYFRKEEVGEFGGDNEFQAEVRLNHQKTSAEK